MNRFVGERFWFPLDPDTTLLIEVAKEQSFRTCNGCYFEHMACWKDSIRRCIGECQHTKRGTVCGVIFKLVDDKSEKGGEEC